MVDNNFGETKELAYDLRQRFALQIGDIRQKIIESREDKDYPRWFNQLDALFIEISHKLDQEEKKYYSSLLTAASAVIKDSGSAYTNKKLDGNKIYMELRKINIWLQFMMEKYDLFGSKFIDDGL